MAISVRSTATNSGEGTAITVTPGSVAEGDWLVAILNVDGASTTIADNNGEDAFTEDIDQDWGFGRVGIYTRLATADEPASYAWTAGASEQWAIVLYAITGADYDLWDVAPIADINTGSSATATADSITATTDGLALFVAVVDNTSATTFSDPTNDFGDEVEVGTTYPMVVYSKAVAAGAVGSTACTISDSRGWGAFLLLVKAGVGYSDDSVADLTQSEIVSLITAPHIEIDMGLELLDTSDNFVADISDDCLGGEVELQWYATLPDTCRLLISRELDWADVRVRPYQTVTATINGSEVSKTWYLGIYCPVEPEVQLGTLPVTYDVTGYSKLSYLARPIGDAYTVAASVDYLTAVKAVITASGMTGVSYSFDHTGTKDTTAALAWVLDSTETTYLKVCNDLLALCGYEPLWVDNLGRFRTAPLVDPEDKADSWTFDLSDTDTQIVGDDRRLTKSDWDRTNYWIFINDTALAGALPAEGTGIETIDNADGGTEYRRVVHIAADSQTELEARAALIVGQQTSRKETLEFPTGPNPQMLEWGRFPTVAYSDGEAGGDLRGKIASVRLPLDGGDCAIEMEVL